MPVDLHQAMRQLIDKSLAEAPSVHEQQTLREHVATCVPCQEYLNHSNRVIAALGGFSFAVDPELQGKVMASLALRAQQLELSSKKNIPIGWSYLAALLLTVAGSLAVYQLAPASLRLGVLALWVVPSLYFCLLFPLLHRLSRRGMHEKGLSQ